MIASGWMPAHGDATISFSCRVFKYAAQGTQKCVQFNPSSLDPLDLSNDICRTNRLNGHGTHSVFNALEISAVGFMTRQRTQKPIPCSRRSFPNGPISVTFCLAHFICRINTLNQGKAFLAAINRGCSKGQIWVTTPRYFLSSASVPKLKYPDGSTSSRQVKVSPTAIRFCKWLLHLPVSICESGYRSEGWFESWPGGSSKYLGSYRSATHLATQS